MEHFPVLGFVHFICPLKRVECNHWMDVSQAAPRDSVSSDLPAPRLRISVRREEVTGPRLIQDIVSTLLKAILREPARYVIYRSLPHELPTRACFLSVILRLRKTTVTNRFLLLSNTFTSLGREKERVYNAIATFPLENIDVS